MRNWDLPDSCQDPGARRISRAALVRRAACGSLRWPHPQAAATVSRIVAPGAGGRARSRSAAWTRTSSSPNTVRRTCGDLDHDERARRSIAIAPPAHRDRLGRSNGRRWLRNSRRQQGRKRHGHTESHHQLRDHRIDPHAFDVAASAGHGGRDRRERARRGRGGRGHRPPARAQSGRRPAGPEPGGVRAVPAQSSSNRRMSWSISRPAALLT